MWVTTADRCRATRESHDSVVGPTHHCSLQMHISSMWSHEHTPLLPWARPWGSLRSSQKSLFPRAEDTGSLMGSVAAALASLIFRFLPNWKNTAL